MQPRPVVLRRSWLLLPGTEARALMAAPDSGADVLIQELEDLRLPPRRADAKALTLEVLPLWKASSRVSGVRIAPLAKTGFEDLQAVMKATPHLIVLPQTTTPEEVRGLALEVEKLERRYRHPPGSTELVPAVESAQGLLRLGEIAGASPRVSACLLAGSGLAHDLGADQLRNGPGLEYPRARFLLECVAAGVTATDIPYPHGDEAGLQDETLRGRQLGYRAKAAVVPEHAATINRTLAPSESEVHEARQQVAAFESAREAGRGGAGLGSAVVALPQYRSARRLLARSEALMKLERR